MIGRDPEVPQIFNTKTPGFGFKLTSLFRSKMSLEAEMKEQLQESKSILTAHIIMATFSEQIPHSAFHSLESTHMRTIISQMNNNRWYKTYSVLTREEHDTLDWIISKKKESSQVIVLKVLHQNRLNKWATLLAEYLKDDYSPASLGKQLNSRVVLVILRENIRKSERIPRPPILMPNQILQPPPLPTINHGTRVFDLRIPPLPVPLNPTLRLGLPPPGPIRPGGGPPPPPPPGVGMRPQGPPPGPPPTPLLPSYVNDQNARRVMTIYVEYTLRPMSLELHPLSANPQRQPRSWQRIVVTQEHPPAEVLAYKVDEFALNGGDVIAAKQRLTEEQAAQVTRLMTDLGRREGDSRFQWCWVKLAIFGANGEEIRDLTFKDGEAERVELKKKIEGAEFIQVVARRAPRRDVRPTALYNQLMLPPPPPPPPPFIPTPIYPPPPRRRRSRYDDDSDSDTSIIYISDVDSILSNYAEDVIKIPLTLKKGGDVVQALLDLWTIGAVTDGGKGKASAK